jgi:hypothetical protein
MNSTLNNILWLISLIAGFSAVILFTYLEDLGLLYRVLLLVGLLGLSLGVLGQTQFGKKCGQINCRLKIRNCESSMAWQG